MVQKVTLRGAVAAAFAVIVLTTGSAAAAPKKTLQAFASDQEISDLFKRWTEEHKSRDGARRSMGVAGSMMAQELSAAPAAPAAKMADSKDESITNVQHAGVDE